MPELDEYTMERVLEEFEQRCYDNMNHAIETEEGLGIEYDEDVVCDVCQSPDGEDGNEMVFCDKCNICVHQVGGQRGPGGSHRRGGGKEATDGVGVRTRAHLFLNTGCFKYFLLLLQPGEWDPVLICSGCSNRVCHQLDDLK